jgi:hypothetical protein
MLSKKLKTLANYCGIRFDNFDIPVVDSQVFLQRFADEIIIHCTKLAVEEAEKPEGERTDISLIIKSAFM